MSGSSEPAMMDTLVEAVTSGNEAEKLRPDGEHRRDFLALERAAACIAAAFQRHDRGAEPLPEPVKVRLISEATLPDPQSNVVALKKQSAPLPRQFVSGLGWALAAAFALAFVVFRADVSMPLTPGEARQALLVEASDVLRWPWRSDQPGYQSVGGDLVWSDEQQSGYMRLVGLAVNDPRKMQYQLWIIDPDRDPNPVDGGVFDVNSRGQVIVPITAKLAIDDPKAFAITVEQPGGVVVSEGPLLLVAALGERPS